MTSLKKQTVSSVKWVFVASMVQRIISFCATVVLARILSPADFGLFSLAFVMIEGFSIFKSLGFDSALVRRKDDIDRACNTAFLLIPAAGTILFIILFISAPIIGRLLGNNSIINVIRALGIIFVISCFGRVPQMILYRSMKFKYRSIAEVLSQLFYVTTAVTLAILKFGVWSLVIAYILKTFIQVTTEWYFSGWKPKLEFDKAIAWDMFHFGKFVLGGSIVWFLYTNLDNIVIGKVLGITLLGYYAIARNISNFLHEYFLSKVSMIMYPAYSKIQEDPADVKRVVLKILKYICMLTFPFSFGLFIFAPDILHFVFGNKWLPAAGVLRILAFVGIFNSLGIAIWPVFLARGKSKADFHVSIAQVIIFFILVVPLAIKFQLLGVGFALLISTIISFIIGLIRAKRIINLEIIAVLETIKLALISSLLMALIAVFVKSLILTNNVNYNFMISAGIAGLAYLAITYFMNKNIVKEIKETFV